MSVNFFKRIVAAGVISLCTTVFPNFSAAQIVPSKVPMLTYADTNVATYDSPGGKQVGIISPHMSLVYVKEIRPDGWAYGSYQVQNQKKRIYHWFRMSDLQGQENFQNYTTSFSDGQTVWRTTSSSSQKIGNILGNQEVLVVGTVGNQAKIIYRVSGGNEYKMGWVDIPMQDNSEPEYQDDTSSSDGGGNENPLPQGGVTISGPVYYVSGSSVNVGGSLDASSIDNSRTDNSYNDNSVRRTNNNVDNSINDNRQNNNITNVDNSTRTRNTNIDNSLNINRGERNSNQPGDVNGNGKINVSDAVDLLRYLAEETDAISEGGADINQDGTIDKNDVVRLLQALNSNGVAVGDVNGDGKLTDDDLRLLKAKVSGSLDPVKEDQCDLNGDGRITSADVNILENLLKYLKDGNINVNLK